MLVNELGVDWSDIHVIGASLGAQVAGTVGYFTQGKINRITGLDPCGPLFHSAALSDRLDKTGKKSTFIFCWDNFRTKFWVREPTLQERGDVEAGQGLGSIHSCLPERPMHSAGVQQLLERKL